ncbi:MAG TPA: M28 family peptidase [Pyrinomonadaceae bacterium]|jgi:Zn-dependent M28 family amino/carboxypeptidase|nr:M28 family peptidase [Pyrinomonadaceae bacterium]
MNNRINARKGSALALLLVVVLGSGALRAARPVTLATPPAESVRAINQTELRMHLEFLASSELGGRYTLSPGINIAARYLASRLASYGFRGAAGADGSFMQRINLVATHPIPAKTTLALEFKGQKTSYSYGDFITSATMSGTATGSLVFVGYGISSAAQKYDDYRGLDVKNKIVVVAPGTPKGIDSSRLADAEEEEGAARAHGAAGVLFLPASYRAADMRKPDYKERIMNRDRVRLAAKSEAEIPMMTLTPNVADALLAPLGTTLDQLFKTTNAGGTLEAKPIDGTAQMTLALEATDTASQNVVGILEGTDPKLKNEYLAISAHYDHLKTDTRGKIYPGADDDGSGTAAVLNIARAFSLQRPARSVLVIFHTGEELGLLGSEYNADIAPVVPLDRIIANLNIDMIGRSRPAGDTDARNSELSDANSIYLIGADRISPELHRLSEQTNAEYEMLRIDYRYNDPNHPDLYYFRSDHWNYAKHDIPIIFYFDGVHADYHQPTDTIEKIDFEKMTRVSRLVFETGWRIANLDHRLMKGSTKG